MKVERSVSPREGMLLLKSDPGRNEERCNTDLQRGEVSGDQNARL